MARMYANGLNEQLSVEIIARDTGFACEYDVNPMKTAENVQSKYCEHHTLQYHLIRSPTYNITIISY
jgi:hypothetical protein